MDDQDYPGNSRNPRRQPEQPSEGEGKKITPVAGVGGQVTRKKRSLGRRFKDAFFGGTTEGVGTYVIFEVALPAMKDMIVDAGGEALHRAVYGESRPSYARSRARGLGSSGLGHIAYDTISTRARETRQDRTPMSRRARANFQFDEIILPQRHIADEVLDRMFMLLEKYQAVTVADLYELLDISAQHTDDKWGWVDLFGSRVTRVSGGYMIELPQPISLD